MAATGGLHRPMNRVAEGSGTGLVTYLGPLPGEGGVVGFAASNRVKILVDRTGCGRPVVDLTSVFHRYLTLSEGVKLAAQTFDKDVAMLSCCAG